MKINKLVSTLRTKYNNLSPSVLASLYFALCSIVQKGIQVIATPIFTRIMSPEEYGIYNVFMSWQAIITVFVSLNLSFGVYMQGLIKFDKDKNKYTSSLHGLTITLVFIWISIYLIFHNFWNNLFELTTPIMISMFVSIWSMATFQFWSTEQRVTYKYKNLLKITLFVSIIKPIFIIISMLIFPNVKVEARIIITAIIDFISFSGLFVVQFKKARIFYDKNFWLYALKFNIPLVPHYLSQIILNQSDRIMIQNLIGSKQAGIYSLAYSLAMLMTIINTAILYTFNPWLYKCIKENKLKYIARNSYVILILIGILNLILIALAPEIVYIFAPAEYYGAIYIIPPVAMSVFFIFQYSMFADFEFYFEKTKFIMLSSMGAAILNIVLNMIFIRLCGYVAAGYTTLISYILYSITHYIAMKNICKKRFRGYIPYSGVLIALFSMVFVAFGFLLLMLYDYLFIRITIVLIISCLVIYFLKKKLKDILCF